MTNVQTTPEVAQNAHQHAAGWGGAPGEYGVQCTCGTAFDGFDSIREAAKLLGDHIAQEARATAEAAPAGPDEMVMAASAGQLALIRIARANMLRAISRMSYAVDRAALPAPAGVRFDTKRNAVVLDFDAVGQAEAWAAELAAGDPDRDAMATPDGRQWRYFNAHAEWRGFHVTLVALVPAAAEQTSAVSA